MLENFKFAVFDVDGTLIDSKRFYRGILQILLKIGFDFLNRCYHNSFEENQGKFILRLKKIIDTLIYDSLERIDIQQPQLFGGARKVLEKLNQKQIKIFGTTGSRKAKERLAQVGTLEFFELVLDRKIPKAKHILLFAEHLGISLEEFSCKAVCIGDEPGDMLLAKRFGLYPVGITNTVSDKILREAGARKVIGSFEELIK